MGLLKQGRVGQDCPTFPRRPTPEPPRWRAAAPSFSIRSWQSRSKMTPGLVEDKIKVDCVNCDWPLASLCRHRRPPGDGRGTGPPDEVDKAGTLEDAAHRSGPGVLERTAQS